MTPKQAANILPFTVVIETNSQRLGTVLQIGQWSLFITWSDGVRGWHAFNALNSVKVY